MMVYRANSLSSPLSHLVSRLCRELRVQKCSGVEQARHWLITSGEVEATLADQGGEDHPAAQVAQQATMALAELFTAQWRGDELQADRQTCARQALDQIQVDLPYAGQRARVQEGYAYYSLYPEQYALAAEQFAREQEAGSVLCLGIRSIGISLAATVVATLRRHWRGHSIECASVRPTGHPFDRQLALTPQQRAQWHSGHYRYAAVVDEGPGLSGSSICAVVDALCRQDFALGQIAVFPAWQTDATRFVSEHARTLWPRLQVYCSSFEEATRNGPLGPQAAQQDWSWGVWRNNFTWPKDMPPAQPQHERRKYVNGTAQEGQSLAKFTGLGWRGEAHYAQLQQLAEAGFSVPVRHMQDGFAWMDRLQGQPLTPREPLSAALLDRMADYLHFVQQRPASTPINQNAIEEMVEVNIREGLGAEWLPDETWWRGFRRSLAESSAAAIDARMLPQEWLACSDTWLKVDGVDHHDDHFFPGPCDIAWDVATVVHEFAQGPAARDALCERLMRRSGEAALPHRLSCWETAYLSFRLGYANMAQQSLQGSPDGARYGKERQRYAAALRQQLQREAG